MTSAGNASTPSNSSTFEPPSSTKGISVWSCYQNGTQCKNWPDVFEQGDTASWELMPTDFPDSCNSLDYELDFDHPEELAAAVCAALRFHTCHEFEHGKSTAQRRSPSRNATDISYL